MHVIEIGDDRDQTPQKAQIRALTARRDLDAVEIEERKRLRAVGLDEV